MADQEDDLDDLLNDQVRKILAKDSITAAEVEVCRKYLNDRAARGGKHFTRGFTSPDAAKKPGWTGIAFDDVRITIPDEGTRDTDAGDSPAR